MTTQINSELKTELTLMANTYGVFDSQLIDRKIRSSIEDATQPLDRRIEGIFEDWLICQSINQDLEKLRRRGRQLDLLVLAFGAFSCLSLIGYNVFLFMTK